MELAADDRRVTAAMKGNADLQLQELLAELRVDPEVRIGNMAIHVDGRGGRAKRGVVFASKWQLNVLEEACTSNVSNITVCETRK